MNSKNIKNNNNNNNKNINKSNNISSPPLPPSPSTPTFRIMTLNVQGLNSKTKQHQLSYMIDLHHISILGLSETKLSNRVAPYIFKKSSNYKLYSHNLDNNINGAGVGLLLSKEMDKYVHKHEAYKGRIIYVNLYMKGHIKLRIIQIYLHATTTGNHPDIEDIYNKLFFYIEDVLDKQFKIMLMGDFNLKYEKYIKDYKRKGHAHWKFDIFRRLDQLNFTDLIPLYHSDISNFDTFHSKNQHLSSSRIDAVWVSHNLLMDTLTADNFPIDLFNTDHHGVVTTLIRQGLFNQNSHATLKQHSIKKCIFSYEKMTPEKWENFSSHLEIVIIKENNTNTLITDPTRIKEVVNEHFQKCPGSKNNPDKVIPPNWSSYYQPIETIDPHIYQNLMSPPSDDEWTLILSALPKDKASGPSGISNEIL
ncbi:Endonuclease/exonuclease/phosphatase [Glomus cerebriforme]|uniref:Endonuclease/exonuclease/phosphatase n=1 Tax=Glomus cerebriforme TaxID=658196 RepID=A0A397SP44_9GLOM|nr:Endonuclease/exonuclease/phosphatase [Glomus cerebriforme]